GVTFLANPAILRIGNQGADALEQHHTTIFTLQGAHRRIAIRLHIGDGAIEGANIALLNRKKRKVLDEIARTMAYIELNAEPSFMDEYTRSTFLPHTDLAQFPMVEELLESCRIRRD
ncbi:MAG TPA: ASKHA domain-containing protein, partial [Methanoregulaceae archaeon]|nr:ASKHA domain-containing protein [Methanoregulaceae archaeon]